jgi:hypothetical protein
MAPELLYCGLYHLRSRKGFRQQKGEFMKLIVTMIAALFAVSAFAADNTMNNMNTNTAPAAAANNSAPAAKTIKKAKKKKKSSKKSSSKSSSAGSSSGAAAPAGQ